MKKIAVLFLLIGFCGVTFAQIPNLHFANGISSASLDEGRAIAIDASGNSYITGYFQGTADFDPSGNTANLLASSQDVFVAKYNSLGVYQWAFQIGGGSSDIGYSIATDASGNVYVTGLFTGPADFDPSGNTVNLSGTSNVFVAKYNSSGGYEWAFSIGNTSADIGYGIKTDASGNVYVTGQLNGTADFDPSGNTANLTGVGGDIFVAKYSTSGAYLWAFNVGGSSTDIGNSITTDVSGNVFVTGQFQGTADFDPSVGITNLVSVGGSDAFVAKYDTDGNYQWAFVVGGSTGSDFGYGISTDASGNVLVTGRFIGTVDFDPSGNTADLTSPAFSPDAFVAKYTTGGAYQWAFNIGGGSGDAFGYGISSDASSNVYVTGQFALTNDFDPSGSTANLTAVGGYDIFVAKYNNSGAYQWAFKMGAGGADVGYGIATSTSGDVYVAGSFQFVVDFDPSALTTNLTSNDKDIFVTKYSNAALPVSLILFAATLQNDNKVAIHWATASETNASHYQVERSNDAISFEVIAYKEAAGNSQERKDYALTDHSPGFGINYYRLCQVDADGKFTYTRTVAVRVENDNDFTIYPVPSEDKLYIKGFHSVEIQAIRIFDLSGRVVAQYVDDMAILNISTLPSGGYLIQLQTLEGHWPKRRFVKQ